MASEECVVVIPTEKVPADVKENKEELRFFVVGDFGTADASSFEVAQAMGELPQPDFIVATGDHVYPNGPKSNEDIDRNWDSIFLTDHTPSLRVPWFLVLGNHDYEGDISLQLKYDNPLWNMPSEYYHQSFQCGNKEVDFYFIDTTPYMALVDQVQFMEFGLSPRYYRMKKFSKKYANEQLNWLRNSLQKSKPSSIRVVVGHYNVYTSGSHEECEPIMSETFVPIFNEFKVHLYFNGHDHIAEHCTNGKTHFFTSGAGSSCLHRLARRRRHDLSMYAKYGNSFMDVSLTEERVQVRIIMSETKEVAYKVDIPVP